MTHQKSNSRFLFRREPFFFFGSAFVVASLLVALSGCDKLDEEARALLSAGAMTAKERAANFEEMKSKIVAKNPEKAAAIASKVDTHAKGLAAQAKALADLVAAVQATPKLVEATKEQLHDLRDTAKARAEEWRSGIGQLSGVSEDWMKAHADGLDAQADILMRAAAKVPLKPKKEAKKTNG